MDRLPKFSAVLAQLVKDGRVPAQVWRTLDQKLTEELLRAASAIISKRG
jgi:hypothetical protein